MGYPLRVHVHQNVSIDTPEVHYPSNQKPSKQDANLAQLADWIQAGEAPVNRGLAQHLRPKLATGKAGTLQESQGVSAADQPFDQYGRLIAYMASSYNSTELVSMTRKERATFNLLMVESGGAATFPIYPSIPRYADLMLLQEVAKDACDNKKGAWADPEMLTGYEFWMCVRRYDITKKLVAGKKVSSRERSWWITRYCVDMTTRELFYLQNYHKVAAYNRIFVWPDDVAEAVARMNLLPVE